MLGLGGIEVRRCTGLRTEMIRLAVAIGLSTSALLVPEKTESDCCCGAGVRLNE